MFFTRKRRYTDLSWMEIDMHNHVLPGLDDGPATWAESGELITALHGLGLKHLYATPHIYSEMYPNSRETINPVYAVRHEHLPAEQVASLGYAAEYMLDSAFEQSMGSNLLSLPGRYILVEMSYLYGYPNLEQCLFNLSVAGYRPILAHPERYAYYQGRLDALVELKDRGCLFQLNLLSLTDHYGKGVHKLACQLVKKGMVDFVGTDAHHLAHIAGLKHLLEKQDVYALLKHNPIRNTELYPE